MWENFLRDDPHHGVISRDTAMTLQRLCDGSSAAFALPTQVLPLRTLSCPLHAVPTGYFPTPMCLAAKKKFIYLRHFRALSVFLPEFVNFPASANLKMVVDQHSLIFSRKLYYPRYTLYDGYFCIVACLCFLIRNTIKSEEC